jgi:hypothetical protein
MRPRVYHVASTGRSEKMAERDHHVAARVIVSCDTSPLGESAIAAAAALARRLDAELKGIFVEDINLIRTAALPFTQEVASATALVRRMPPGELQQLLERQAQSVRGVLAQAASALSLQWTFQVVRGAPLISVLDVMQGLDLAVFGHLGRFSTHPAAAAAVPTRQPVMVIYDGTPAADRALDAAAALAEGMRCGLVVALMDTSERASTLRTQARAQLERHHPQRPAALFLAVKHRNAEAVGRAVDTCAPAVLLWGGVARDADRATLSTLVDALRCPVVLVT